MPDRFFAFIMFGPSSTDEKHRPMPVQNASHSTRKNLHPDKTPE